ncbi:MAG: Sua5/YciO/YrdC/YwlC family protein [Gammaproteobacteria bacterium]|nr:Sua5/YciO/YrdC/YwlC family protein [Gammaproteobacteria bacterium]
MNRWQLSQAAGIVRAGGVIAYPTEYCFGLGCDPLNLSAVLQLLSLKQRPISKGLILVAADYSQVDPYIGPLPTECLATVKATWPGPHTWVLPAARGVPEWLRGDHDGIALRVSAHPQVVALCRASGGPLVSTSANLTGCAPARSLLTLRRQFRGSLDGYLPGPLGGAAAPTEIRDALSGAVVRPA